MLLYITKGLETGVDRYMYVCKERSSTFMPLGLCIYDKAFLFISSSSDLFSHEETNCVIILIPFYRS